MKTIVGNGHHGWYAETHVSLDSKHVLVINTGKRFGGDVTTNAKVNQITGEYLAFCSGNFSETIIRDANARCSQKLVRAQHAVALESIDAVKAAAVEHIAATLEAA